MKQQPTGKGKALVSLLLSLTLLISVLCVPLSANAFAPQAGETVTYTFAKGQGNYGNVAAADGIGYGSWGMWPVYDKDGNGVLTQKIALNPKQTWATAGGIRLNNSDGFYELEPETTYAVTVKVRVLSAPALLSDNKKNVSTAALAWGFEYNSSFSATNRINVTNHIDQAIYTAVSGSDTYTVTDLTGSKNYPYGENWHEAVYLITTPQDLGKGVAHFGLYVKSFTGLHSEIDEVSVTRLGAEDSAVVIVDEYSDEKSLLVGRIGEKVTLPSDEEMQQKAKDPTHIFEGWFTDEERTEPVGVSPEFENHSRQFYSRWKAPVTVTFHDDLNGTDVPVSGYAGSELTYPQDPTAPESAGKKWFIGWYTTAAATEEFKSTVFPGKNITVYAGYKGEVTDTAQGFESYEDIAKNEVVTVKDSKTGLMYKTYKRRGNFAIPFSLQSEEKAEGEKAVVFRWDSTRTFDIQNETDRENPEAYDAASAYNSRSNAFFLSEVPQKGETYTVTFRYKVAKANGQPKLQLYSSGPSNIWQDATLLGTALLDPAVDGQWKTGEALITVSQKSVWATAIMGVVILPKNADAEIYFDDFVFKAKQPYESEVEIHPNNGGESIRLFGERGSEIVFPKITNQSFRLKGYFTDEACTVPFTGSVYTRQKITLYAAWENAPISFENYGFADESGKVSPTMSLLAGSGVGCKDGDDAALAFRFNGSDIYSEKDGQIVYMGSRAAMRDHSARLLQVKDKTLYRITYYYKNRPESNVSYRLFFSVSSENIWDAKSYNSGVSQTERIITKNESGWTKAEVYYKTDLKTVYGNWLFLQATLLGGGNTKVASCDIDDIFVEEIPAPYVIFEPNNEGAQVVRNGNMGDPIDFPAVKNGKAELLGWYTDEALTVPFTETTYTGEFRVYAKWSNAPISFEDYKYTADGVNIGQTMRIIRQNGVGCTDGDDAVLGFRFNGSDIYSEKDGQIVYMGSRFNMRDHNARLKQVENHAFYRITYYYRNNPETNTAYRLFFSTSSENIWETPVYVNGRESTERLVSPQENGWTKVQTYLKTDFPKAHGNWLFLQATTMSGSQNTVVSCDIDDILIEKIEPPYVVFNLQNGEESQLLQGSEGSPIVLPQTPYRHGFTFTGWYADAACTTPFTQKVFTADTETFVYAGWRQNRTVVYDFENYGCIDQDGKMQLCDVIYQHRSEAASGSGVLYVDRRTENGATLNPAGAYAGVAWGTELYETDGASYYVISAKVYVLSKGNSNFTLTGRIAGKDNLWAYGTNDTTNRAQVRRSVPTGTWTKVTFTLDASKAKKAEGRYLYLRMAGGNEGQYLVDDVTVTRLDPGEIPVVVEQVGGKTDRIPEYVSGPKGSDYSSLLPQNPKLDNILFMGYCFINDKDEYERITDTRIGEEAGRIYARLQRSVIAQNFDDGNYQAEWNRPLTYRIADFDYELYDAQAAGHSADNVTSGRYSLHRKGKTPYFENALLLTQGDELSDTGRYTVTMKVKLGKHFHSDGAVKIVSNRSPYYAWTTTGDYYPIISIKDLEDGKWHEVSYTFNSVEVYASLQTPGYCELFVDDVVFTLVDENTPLSTPAEYTEYVPARRDEQGNLLGYGSGDGFDLTKIWDVSLYQKPEENPVVLILLIGGAALVLAAGAAVWLILRGKRRKKASL